MWLVYSQTIFLSVALLMRHEVTPTVGSSTSSLIMEPSTKSLMKIVVSLLVLITRTLIGIIVMNCCHPSSLLSASLSSEIIGIIIDNNDPLYSYGLSSSLQSTRLNLSCIIAGNNDCYYTNNKKKKEKDGFMLSLSLLPSINQDNNRKIVIFLLSLFIQAWICIYVFANLHSILDPCLVSIDDTFLSSTLSSFMFLLSQVWIYLYVIAILHNILDPCLVSRGDIFLTSSLSSTSSLLSKVMISIHVIASLHNIVDSQLLSSGDHFTSRLLSLIMLKSFQVNQRSLFVLTLSLFLQLVYYNDSVIELNIIGDTSDVDDNNSCMIFTSDINTSDDNKTITVTSKIDYMTIKLDIFTQNNNHMDDILLWVLLSLLFQVLIYIHVNAILQHSI